MLKKSVAKTESCRTAKRNSFHELKEVPDLVPCFLSHAFYLLKLYSDMHPKPYACIFAITES